MLCDKYKRLASGVATRGDREIDASEEYALIKMMEIPEYASYARELLYHRQTRFLISYVRSYTHKGLPMEDLIMWGRVGLDLALSKYVLGCGTRFSTYSRNWVLKPVRSALHGAHFLSLPAYRHDQLQKLRSAMRTLPEGLSSEEYLLGLSRATGLASHVVSELLSIHQYYPVSWDEITVDSTTSVGESSTGNMEDALRGLPPDDAQFLDLLLGLYTNPGEPIPIIRISKIMGKSIPYLEAQKRFLFDILRGSLSIY